MDTELIFEQPSFVEEEIYHIPGTYSGITRSGKVWNYRKGDWHKLTPDTRTNGKMKVGIASIETGKFKTYYVSQLLREHFGIDIRDYNKHKHPCMIVETGEEFDSQKACADYLDVSRAYIHLAIKENRAITKNKYHIVEVGNGECDKE